MISTVLGDVVGLMTQSPRHAKRTVEDIEQYLVPPILLNQLWVAEVPIQGVSNMSAPVAVVVWIDATDRLHQELLRAPHFSPND